MCWQPIQLTLLTSSFNFCEGFWRSQFMFTQLFFIYTKKSLKFWKKFSYNRSIQLAKLFTFKENLFSTRQIVQCFNLTFTGRQKNPNPKTKQLWSLQTFVCSNYFILLLIILEILGFDNLFVGLCFVVCFFFLICCHSTWILPSTGNFQYYLWEDVLTES